MKEQLKESLLVGDFEKIDEILKNLSFEEKKYILLELAIETGYLSIYSYICYKISENSLENIFWHHIAITVLANGFCYLEGGYSAAFYHAKKVLELEPENIKNLEQMLFFYDIPEKLLKEEEAVKIAKKVLANGIDSEWAKSILNK